MAGTKQLRFVKTRTERLSIPLSPYEKIFLENTAYLYAIKIPNWIDRPGVVPVLRKFLMENANGFYNMLIQELLEKPEYKDQLKELMEAGKNIPTVEEYKKYSELLTQFIAEHIEKVEFRPGKNETIGS